MTSEPTNAQIEAGLAYLSELGLNMDDGRNDWLSGLYARMRAAHPLAKMVREDEEQGLYDDEPISHPNPEGQVTEAALLTPAFKAMTPLQKWETLVLSGLIGTDEPWIEDMRQALREQEAALASTRAAPDDDTTQQLHAAEKRIRDLERDCDSYRKTLAVIDEEANAEGQKLVGTVAPDEDAELVAGMSIPEDMKRAVDADEAEPEAKDLVAKLRSDAAFFCGWKTRSAHFLEAADYIERISSRDNGLLAWLADNPALELSWQEVGGDLSECAWHVHRCHGGRNDREWEAIAYAETPKRALELARATSSGARE